MDERARLREKSTLVEAKVKKLEEGIKKDFLDKKIVVIKQDAHDCVEKIGGYCRELINLMPWIRLYITRGITDGDAMQMVKCAMQTVKIKGRFFPREVINGWLKLYIGGSTT